MTRSRTPFTVVTVATVAFVLLACGAIAGACGGTGGTSDTGTPEDTGPGGSSSLGEGGSGGGTPGAGGGAGVVGGAGGQGGTLSLGGSGGKAGSGGHAPICLPDEDGDEIPDEVEGKSAKVDTDGDGIPDYLDLDSDNDSIPDLIEGDTVDVGCNTPLDSDSDGIPDFRDTDSDGNGILDRDEVHPDGSPYDPSTGPPSDTDGDGSPDYTDPDNDNDALPDTVELVAGMRVDTDGDGLPDFDDVDSDGDTIADGQDGLGDVDQDGAPNFRDTDSDNDGVPDACEAGKGHVVTSLPADTDKDGKYDFVDLDSDGDGLLDGDEDKDGNCVIDLDETDRISADTDGDGASDLIEATLGSDPDDPSSTPQGLGKYYFILPYMGAPEPDSQVVPVVAALQRGDIAFLLDTTASMGGEEGGLKSGLPDIINEAKSAIPDLAVGIAAHDDFPVSPYGDLPNDTPFYIPAGGHMTPFTSTAISAITSLTIHSGGDLPESQILGMWRMLTNGAYEWPGTVVMPEDVPGDRFGAMHFRKTALPILISVTDAPFHNGRFASAPAALQNKYSFDTQAPYPVPTVDDLVQVMNDEGARFLGLAADDGVRSGSPYDEMAYIADQSSSVAPPKAFGGTQCLTELGGNALSAPDGPNGTCRLVFNIRKDGSGLTQRVVDGIKALLKSLALDIRVIAIPDDPTQANGFIDSVDTFLDHVEVSLDGLDDPVDPLVPCVPIVATKVQDVWTGPKGDTFGSDGYDDTVQAFGAGKKICFRAVPIPNVTIPSNNAVQVFHAVLQIRAKKNKKSVEIDFGEPRDLLFVIPPNPQ